MGFDLRHTLPLIHLFNDPGDGFAQGRAEHSATGLADGRQAYMSPLLRTVVPQLAHQGAVRQEHEIPMPGLARATPELTRAHAQMLLPVPMEGLGAGPALARGLQDAMAFPRGALGDQDLAWCGIPLLFPQHRNPHRVRDAGNADTLGEVPLNLAVHGRLAPTQRPHLGLDPRTRLAVLTIDRDGAIKLQIPDVVALRAGDLVADLGVGEVTVEGEVAGDGLLNHPIDQLFASTG